jgi:hypothetical protein
MLKVREETTVPQEPTEDDEHVWDVLEGEQPDSATRHALNLAHRAIERFPDLARRHRRFTGPAAVLSTGVVLLAGIAIARRLRLGEHPDQILDSLTPDEIESAGIVEEQEKVQRHRQIQEQIQKMWRRLKPKRKRRGRRAPESGDA